MTVTTPTPRIDPSGRAYDPVDLSSRAFWATTAADRERSFAELRAE
ncbi:cytochrome P450, partial [Enterococcus faecium]